jgi:hypothetical protein
MISYSGNLEAKLLLLLTMEWEPYILDISSYPPSTLSNIVDVHVLASAQLPHSWSKWVATNNSHVPIFNELFNMWPKEFPCFFKKLG